MKFNGDILYPFILSLHIIVFLVPLFLFTGILSAYLALYQKRVINELLDSIATLPLVFPPIVIGFSLLYIFGKNGVLGKHGLLDIIFTFKGLVLAGFIAGLPFIVRSVKSGINNYIIELSQAAYTLGKNNLSTFFHVVLPHIRLPLLSGMILAIGRVLGEVGISLIIGGNISGKTNTISLEIYNSVLDGEYEKAIFFSGLLCLFSLFIFSLLKIINVRTNRS